MWCRFVHVVSGLWTLVFSCLMSIAYFASHPLKAFISLPHCDYLFLFLMNCIDQYFQYKVYGSLKILISAWIILDFLIFMISSEVVTKRVSCFFIGTVEEWCVVNQDFLWILAEKNSEGRGNGDCQQQKGRHTKATHFFLGARGYVSTDPSLKHSLGN